ncbi:hypothetical protein FisN_6Hh239 [Fistulifera solaris]|jgi:hypothetical protein|uniref:F-box domain-containing protein n=1 Tax=Fistulifera solaris TaxID=1519565 RepID=A0A1Z5K2N3_FISSO|nr:hypothetical protein FisN_6Hh239 [Fistulifera solaris]|eukprot:GAX20288.1 hypothetical protein FisN_6Hh239 [Fistulifera solaris]
MSALVALPDDALQQIAAFLPPKAIAHFLCCSRSLHSKFDTSDLFWTRLLREQFPQTNLEKICSVTKDPKEAFLVQVGARDLNAVKWIRLEQGDTWPSDREGHLCARMGNSIVMTGGFTDDDDVYVFDLSAGNTSKTFARIRPTVEAHQVQESADPTSSPQLAASQLAILRPLFVYGASFTALDSNRAVRFGGFCSGGYSSETSQVVLLTLNGTTASWRVVSCKRQSGGDPMSQDWSLRLSRAYHTATLLFDRYLLILGGMQRGESTWEPAILDTLTWTWLDQDISPSAATAVHPSNRHGHSVVVDPVRNRLVLFGGGNGSDLLRSGRDNTEVWECPLPSLHDDLGIFLSTMWNCLQEDQIATILGHANGGNGEMMTGDDGKDSRRLTAVEALCLGRCHSAFRVSHDKVILTFGSGRPSTNGILGYDLAENVFWRPKILGKPPLPRFTFASVFLEEYGYVFIHGGFSSQYGSSIADGCFLDLAGSIDRACSLMGENTDALPHPTPTNATALQELEFLYSDSRIGDRSRSLLQYLQALAQGEFVGSDNESEGSGDVPP